MSDEEYTRAVDNGTYSEESFRTDRAGYGLCQWTHKDRKGAMYRAIKGNGKSIGDLYGQLEFMWKELDGYKSVLRTLFDATSVREASDAVMLKYEVPGDTSEKNREHRAALGQSIYDRHTVDPEKGGGGAMDSVLLNEKAKKCVEIAESKIGDPYVFGAWGQPCTPETRKKYAGYRPEYKSKIYGECPVL